MSVPSAKFAFQINAHQAFNSLDSSSEKILASKKAEVTREDGSTTQMTIFFAADKKTLSKMQNDGEARSNRQTMEDFKRFCMSTQKGLSTSQFAKGMRNVKEMSTSENVKPGKNFTDQLRVDYDASMNLPYGLFAGKFSKASEAGLLVRVNARLEETKYTPPEKKGSEITGEEAQRLRRKLAGTEETLKAVDLNVTSSSNSQTFSDSKVDRKEKTASTPPKRHSIVREKHINNRRQPMANPPVSIQTRDTQTVINSKEATRTDTQVLSGTITTTNTNPHSD